ncbi:MAG: SAM-dependent methyltransferase [Deltaproteobacteria bacterium]|jgi:23S rRNA (cytidine2498-2'-O)-methyltransferase
MAWAFLTRAGSEADLVEELGTACDARRIAPGVVLAEKRPRGPDGAFREVCFARQAMRAEREVEADPEAVVKTLAALMKQHRPRQKNAKPWTWALQLVAPDASDPKDPRRAELRALEEAGLEERLVASLPEAVASRRVPAEEADRIVQAWIVDGRDLLVGVTSALQVLSRWPGGKMRLRRPDDAPSRSGLKLEEAMHWVGVGPERGDLVADLGAAPGGWSQVALERGAVVIAVDPAKMKIPAQKKKFEHLQQSAFDYTPQETLDWVICDMAWRPREVAALLAKWGRRAWARQLFVNFKLPMKKKAAILKELLATLTEAGWEGVRARQLYHDRDEVTVFGWLNAGLVARGMLAPFELNSKKAKPKRGRSTDRGAAGRKSQDKKAAGRARGRGRSGGRGGRSGGRAGGPRGRSGGPRGRGRR